MDGNKKMDLSNTRLFSLTAWKKKVNIIQYKLQRVLVWKKKSRIALDAYAAFLFTPTRAVAS